MSKLFKIISKPEGNPTFIDENTGAEREYLRIHEVVAETEKDARRVAEFSNWDQHVEHDVPPYDIVSVEEI